MNAKESKQYIVGIGASAGGLEALQKLLTALSPNTGFVYVIVQHLSPDYKSLLGEILSKYTTMPVVQVEDGMEARPNHVYVIQPGKNMRIKDGKLLLSSQKEKELNLPIDMFFRSLAEEAGPNAIAIVLSGTGSDGTNGIKDIKENDGMIIVQDIESSKFDGMPRSAMRTGLVDVQIPPEEIALELQHIANATRSRVEPVRTERQIDDDLMKKIYFILKKISNINFTHYKQTTILRRIERRMMLTHKETLADYVAYLYEAPDEVKVLSKEVLIGVTSFFRAPDYFQCLKDKAIQSILIHSSADEPIRAWVAGCSTGEEAYSIAILFCEMMETLKIKRAVKIFATDLDAEAIVTAGKGVYSDSIIDAVSPARLSRFFTRKNNTYTVNRDIRKMIVFSPHNVFQDPPFGRLDLISCRNMMIYFQPVLQNDLFAIFHSALKDGGYLFLGKSEAIGSYTEAFPVVDPAAKIFTHRADVKIAGAKAIPFLQTTFGDDDGLDDVGPLYTRKPHSDELGYTEQFTIDSTLMERFMPACVVINEKNEVVHTFGENGNYLHFSLGKFSNSIFDVITDALKIPVSTLLKEAREKQQMVQYKDIAFTGEHDPGLINLTAMPISKRAVEGDSLYALIFSELAQRGEMPDAVPYEIDKVASQRISDLEQDLSGVQERLNRSVAEQECVNEELQAANEELLTANEELQSSNEELQSVNEELYTVNSEYQTKLTELADLNDDIANFLSSTLIGIIFVDNKLNIRRYTDYVTTEFSVMDHDIGRSLKFISYHFPTVDISEICDNVLKTLVPDEREVATSKKKMFFMRVAPYRTTEDKILGCVITLVDVTSQKQGQAMLQSTEKRLTMVQQASEAKSDYISRIAHEIRMPMNALSRLHEAMEDQRSDPGALENSLKEMSETLDYMASIVSDLSEAALSERSSGEPMEEPFELMKLMDDVALLMQPSLDDARLRLDIDIAPDYHPVYIGCRVKLQQILVTFLNNAVKCTRRDGVITLKAYEEAGSDAKASVCFVISDTGMGYTKAMLDTLFRPYPADESESRETVFGSSLGLSIAYNLIVSMGGDVSAKSALGKGSIFTVRVMLGRCSEQGDEPDQILRAAPKEYHLSGNHVLIADDNAMNRLILSSMLTGEGVTFVEVADGNEAIEAYLSAPDRTFSCVLMDMKMPKLDGIKATSAIRASGKPDALTIPIIGVSANGFAKDIQHAREAGINEYITKPINRDNLFSAMSRLIQP